MTNEEALKKKREEVNRKQREGGAGLRDHMMKTGLPPIRKSKKKAK